MYKMLFDLAGFGIFGWAVLIFFPTWRLSRRIAESAVIPLYVAAIYLVGVIAVFREQGPGIMADFGSYTGVLGLLQQESVAMVAWIHILAFDQVVAHLIYRDNMRHRFVPIPVQSVILFVTLMLGPIGFLSYYLVRTSRSRQLVGWGERTPQDVPVRTANRFADVVTERSIVRASLQLWKREGALVRLSALALLFAVVCTIVATVNGGWLIEPAGRLKEAMRFDVAIAIYLLTLALIVPLAGFDPTESRRWHRWMIGLVIFSLSVENLQILRGVDPRFSSDPLDSAIGGIFFLSALGIMALFIEVTARFFSNATLGDHPALRIALRYASATAIMGFVVGIIMSGVRTREIGAGSMMLIHAGGFHGLQAVPVVALLAGWSALSVTMAQRMAHIAGAAWVLFCIGLGAQAFSGNAPFALTPYALLSVAGIAVWLIAFAVAIYGAAGRAVIAETPRST